MNLRRDEICGSLFSFGAGCGMKLARNYLDRIPRAVWRLVTDTVRRKKPPELPLVRLVAQPRLFERVIFICGLHRSGTTLLEDLIRSRFEVAVLRAPVPENEGQHLQDVYPPAFRHGGAGRFAFAPEMHPQAPTQIDAAVQHRRIMACWSHWVTGECETLLEKSPPNLTKIAYLRRVFPAAKFIIVTRDPRVVAVATQKWSKTSIPELIFHWHVAHSAALQSRSDDCCHVRYEDLCDDPENLLRRVGEQLNLCSRPQTQSLNRRFLDISNTNSRYLARFPDVQIGDGAWLDFGYVF